MNRSVLGWIGLLSLVAVLSVGCGAGETDSGEADGESSTNGASSANGDAGSGEEHADYVRFVGRHTDKSKEDRLGSFEEFNATLEMDGNTPTSLGLTVNTASVKTEFADLTAHLQNDDFFDVNVHPEMTFTSTGIEAGEKEGEFTITGELTLLGETKSLSFAAMVSEDGAHLNGEFEFDRVEYGMIKMTEGVEPLVKVSFSFSK